MSGYDFSLLNGCTVKEMNHEAATYSDAAEAIFETADSRGLGRRMHLGVEVTESSTNKQHHLFNWQDVTKRRGLKEKVNEYWRKAEAIRLYARTGETSVKLNGTLGSPAQQLLMMSECLGRV